MGPVKISTFTIQIRNINVNIKTHKLFTAFKQQNEIDRSNGKTHESSLCKSVSVKSFIDGFIQRGLGVRLQQSKIATRANDESPGARKKRRAGSAKIGEVPRSTIFPSFSIFFRFFLPVLICATRRYRGPRLSSEAAESRRKYR